VESSHLHRIYSVEGTEFEYGKAATSDTYFRGHSTTYPVSTSTRRVWVCFHVFVYLHFVLCRNNTDTDCYTEATERNPGLTTYSSSYYTSSASCLVSLLSRISVCMYVCMYIQCVPLATEPGISLIILTPMKISQRNYNRSTFVM